MLLGRENEQKRLLSLLGSDESEFVAIYGRRRVGKTYLVRQTFEGKFAFEHTGLKDGTKTEQLAEFRLSLIRSGMNVIPKLNSWSDAFFYLGQHLASLPAGKKIVFIDELPWMDTIGSHFVSNLDHFWNGWANMRNDIVLIVCGSATSWIISKIVRNHGGLHNRLTAQIYLRPFTLHECEMYARARRLGMNRQSILETYMILGGIPYYWRLLNAGNSWMQNIDQLFFQPNAELKDEFNALYASLFRSPQPYIDVVTALGKKKAGMTREEIIQSLETKQGGRLSLLLEELEQCDFIRSYAAIGKRKKETIFQLIDNFTLFYFKFMADANKANRSQWQILATSPTYRAWSGLAFERVCLQHERQILYALGISGIACNIYSWLFRPTEEYPEGAQIDLLIDRSDQIINLCEIKFSSKPFLLTKEYDEELRRKMSIFEYATKTRKGIRIVMITSYGLVQNAYANDFPNQLTMDDLFVQ